MAKKATKRGRATPTKKITLVATDEKQPSVKITAPAQIEIVEIQAISPESKKVDLIAARLCGYGSNVCLAIVEV